MYYSDIFICKTAKINWCAYLEVHMYMDIYVIANVTKIASLCFSYISVFFVVDFYDIYKDLYSKVSICQYIFSCYKLLYTGRVKV